MTSLPCPYSLIRIQRKPSASVHPAAQSPNLTFHLGLVFPFPSPYTAYISVPQWFSVSRIFLVCWFFPFFAAIIDQSCHSLTGKPRCLPGFVAIPAASCNAVTQHLGSSFSEVTHTRSAPLKTEGQLPAVLEQSRSSLGRQAWRAEPSPPGIPRLYAP